MGTAQHSPPSLLFTRAVLAGYEAQVARHVRRATEARGIIQCGDIRGRRDGSNARHGRQSGDDGILAPRCVAHPVVRRGELLVEDRDHALQRRERLGDRRRQVQSPPSGRGSSRCCRSESGARLRVIARTRAIARVRLSVSSRRTLSCACTVRCVAERRCAAR